MSEGKTQLPGVIHLFGKYLQSPRGVAGAYRRRFHDCGPTGSSLPWGSRGGDRWPSGIGLPAGTGSGYVSGPSHPIWGSDEPHGEELCLWV